MVERRPPLVRYACLALFFLLASCATRGKTAPSRHDVKTGPDQVTERFAVLCHPSSGEKEERLYYHDGAYDPEALDAINRLFRDRRADVVGTIDPELIDFLVDIRTRLGLPTTVRFEILSGYRTAATNDHLLRENNLVARDSLHKRGLAVDFRIQGVSGKAIAAVAQTMQRGGVSFYPEDNHVHVDIGAIRTWSGARKDVSNPPKPPAPPPDPPSDPPHPRAPRRGGPSRP